MSGKYELRNNDGVLDGLTPFTPHVYKVVDRETRETVGEVTAWDKDRAGEKIARGEIKPSKD